MALLIGVDEAGYGPNLGPLVVAATAWEVEEERAVGRGQKAVRKSGERSDTSSPPSAYCSLPTPDLYALLRRAVTREPDGNRVAIADSKALYKPGTGLANLERGVLTTLLVAGAVAKRSAQSPSPRGGGSGWGRRDSANGRPHPSPPPQGEGTGLKWSSLLQTLEADVEQRQREVPWHEEFDCEVPCACERDDIHSASERLASAMNSARVQIKCIRARLVFPGEFNELCAQYGNKAAALSEVTMRLVREVVGSRQRAEGSAEEVGRGQKAEGSSNSSSLPSAYCPLPTLILCDKHGGRNHYAALVQQHFPESWVETLHESRAESWYRTSGDTPMSFCFRMKGESFLPAALASMTAKYVRELSMRAFNEYWCARVKDLRPTAGYPADAKRFRVDIAHEQRRLGISDRVLWRER